MDALVWLFLPLFTAAGSGLLAFLIMKAKMEVAVSKEREHFAEAQATIKSSDAVLQEKVKAAAEEARRRSFDELLADIRVEERHYVKESKSLFINRKAMVLQERMFFRNIPLSNWVSHEFPVEESTDLQSLVRAYSIFSSPALSGAAQEPAKFLPS